MPEEDITAHDPREERARLIRLLHGNVGGNIAMMKQMSSIGTLSNVTNRKFMTALIQTVTMLATAIQNILEVQELEDQARKAYEETLQ